MTDKLAVGKERLRKEIEEVRARINGHRQLAAQLELSLLELRARPRPFGELALPTQEQIKLSSAEKFRLRNGAEISKQELGKFIGIRVSDYKHEPQSFVVELTVTNNRGTLVGPYYAAFRKKPDGSYRVLKSQMPHMIIISETQRNFPLENEQQLGEFVRELRVCCQSYVDRKGQIEDLMAVRDTGMIPTISFDEGYLFLQLGVMLDKVGAKLGILYRHNGIFPHKFTLSLRDTAAHRTWSESLKLLYKCTLVEALGLLTVKESPPDSENETGSLIKNVGTATTENSQTSRKMAASTSKSSVSHSTKKAKRFTSAFNFSDSSDDEANRSGRMRKKRAKIVSNIHRKTYWGALSQQASQVASEIEKNSGSSILDSGASEDMTSAKTTQKKNAAASKKKTKATKSGKKIGGKQPRKVASKISRLTTPPAVPDSELSDDETAPNPARSAKKTILAPLFRKSSAAKGSVRKTSPEAVATLRTQNKEKQPLLAAIFHKTRRSLLALDREVSQSTSQGAENTRQESTKPSEKPAESPASSAVQSNKGKSLKTFKKTAFENQKSPPKNSQSSQDSKISSDSSTIFREEHNSDTVISETNSVNPRKVSRLKSNSQGSEVGMSEGWGSLETLVRQPALPKEKVKLMKQALILLPRIEEKDLSLHKRKASEESVGREQGPSQEKTIIQSSPQKKRRSQVTGSGVEISGRIGRIQNEDLVRRSPRKKDKDQDRESGVVLRKGGPKSASEVGQGGKRGKIQDENLVRRSPRKKDNDQVVESGVGVGRMKGQIKTSTSEVSLGKKKGRV